MPSLYLVTQDEAGNLLSLVAGGGTAVLSFWTGIVDEHDQVYLGPYGGPLRPLIGCDVVDVAPLAPGETVEVEWEDGSRTTASFWVDITTELTDGGRVLARVASGPWAGSAGGGPDLPRRRHVPTTSAPGWTRTAWPGSTTWYRPCGKGCRTSPTAIRRRRAGGARRRLGHTSTSS